MLTPVHRRRRIIPFLDGMADRLRQRLRALKPPAPTGTGLVVLKRELVAKALADAGIELRDQTARSSRDWEQTYQDGRRAADGVALNAGVSGQGAQARIGAR